MQAFFAAFFCAKNAVHWVAANANASSKKLCPELFALFSPQNHF
jgi:hypothetical protein